MERREQMKQNDKLMTALTNHPNPSCLNLTGLNCGLSSNSSLTDNNPENGPRFFISQSALLLEMDTQPGPGTRHDMLMQFSTKV